MSANKPRGYATCYVMIYLHMASRARELGYALALHGSLQRDADIVAIPWTLEAVPEQALVKAMIESSGGFLKDGDPCPGLTKPHGRLPWTIHLGGGPYIDLSVMPRSQIANHELVSACRSLMEFLSKNAGDNADWPLDLLCRDESTANELSGKLNRIAEVLKDYPAINPLPSSE